MTPFNLLTIFITAGALAVGLVCFVKNKKSLVNFVYLSITILLVLFITVLHLGYVFIDIPWLSLLFIRFTFSVATLGSVAICSFAYLYPRKIFSLPRSLIGVYFLVALFLAVIACTTGLVYEREIVINNREIQDIHGPLHLVFMGYYFGNLLLALGFLYKKLALAHRIERAKIKLVMWGVTSLVVPIFLFHMVLPRFGIYVWQTEVVYFYFIFIVLAGYSMLRYRFLNVQFTITRVVRHGVTFLLTALFITGAYGIVMMIPGATQHQTQILPLLSVVAIVMYFHLLRGLVADLFSRFFGLTGIEKFRNALYEFTQRPVLYETVEDFREALKELFWNLQMDCMEFVCFQKGNKKSYAKFIQYFISHPEILVQNEQQFLPGNKSDLPHFASLGGVCVPLFRSPGEPMGMLVLGEKSLGDLYSAEEIELLNEFRHFLELRMIGIIHSDYLKQEVRKKTRELHQKNKKLKVLDQAKDTFLSIASHELRTPMTVIGGFAELLLSDKKARFTKQHKEFLKSIADNAKNLHLLVDKMLDISALEAGKMEFEWSEVAFPKCLEKIIREFEPLAKEKNIQLEFQNPENVQLKLKTDSLKIKQIMGNLLGNALKFTPAKGTITVLLQKQKNGVQISVADTGIGIPKAEQEMIFQKFHRTQHSRQATFSGSGLGLHIVQLLVEKLGGTISVTSEKNKGTCFAFTIFDQK